MAAFGTAPAQLPTGTVTFLFTDVEGSTRLLNAHPDAYRLAILRHHDLLLEAVHLADGAVFETVGDAVYAAFARPTDAVKAALHGQLALQGEEWGDTPIRVRMGIHLGEVELQGDHYFGAPLYRCARIMAAGHGGQAVLSAAAAELVRDALPDGARLIDMGEHRLRDLARPEHIFQLLGQGLPSDFPPLRTLDTVPNNLPLQLSSFIGRQKELVDLEQHMTHGRLITLTGAGGCGKTRLALQAAADLLDHYPDGVWVAELAPVADPAHVPSAVAQAVGLHSESGQALSGLVAHLKERRALLLLDNCEHVVETCAHLTDALLRQCPHLHILATSREALGIAGETAWRVPSFAVPSPGEITEIAQLTQYEAVRLFIDRATAANPQFAVTRENAPAIAQVCWRLDGIPLALELAASRARSLVVEQIAQRLDDRFRLLTGGSRTALPRQQTLRALVDWSYDLLSDADKAVLRRLSVFMGGCTLEAAETVCAEDGVETWEVVDVIDQLVDKSLVLMEARPEGARYRLLETIRMYSRDRLLESGEAAAVRDRLLAWCLAFIDQAPGPRRHAVIPEQENIRAALEWALDGDPVRGLELAVRAADLWQWRGRQNEAVGWLETYLQKFPAEGVELSVRARTLRWLGRLTREAGHVERARKPLEDALALYRTLGDTEGIGHCLENLALIARAQDRTDDAVQLFDAAMRAHTDAGSAVGVETIHRDLGTMWLALGDLDKAESELRTALALCAEQGRRNPIVELRLGVLAWLRGDFATAREMLAGADAIARPVGFRSGVHTIAAALADLDAAEGNVEAARTGYRGLIEEARRQDFELGWLLGPVGLGVLAAREGDYRRAARLLGYLTPADTAAQWMHAPYVVAPIKDALAASRTALGDAAYDDEVRKARAMSVPDYATFALSTPASSQTRQPAA
ncbi:MAG: ATP-binding protein [Chloroflexota bacterium]